MSDNNQEVKNEKQVCSGSTEALLLCPEFDVGDFVYIDNSDDVGQISDVHQRDSGKHGYRVSYCQFKDPDRGTCGGNGPVWVEGYPKPVTEPADVLFVAAMKESEKIKLLKRELKNAEINFADLKRAKCILEAYRQF